MKKPSITLAIILNVYYKRTLSNEIQGVNFVMNCAIFPDSNKYLFIQESWGYLFVWFQQNVQLYRCIEHYAS